MAPVCSFDVVLARSFELYGPDRLADPPVPLVWVGPDGLVGLAVRLVWLVWLVGFLEGRAQLIQFDEIDLTYVSAWNRLKNCVCGSL